MLIIMLKTAPPRPLPVTIDPSKRVRLVEECDGKLRYFGRPVLDGLLVPGFKSPEGSGGNPLKTAEKPAWNASFLTEFRSRKSLKQAFFAEERMETC